VISRFFRISKFNHRFEPSSDVGGNLRLFSVYVPSRFEVLLYTLGFALA
jgi:hypothetical protein